MSRLELNIGGQRQKVHNTRRQRQWSAAGRRKRRFDDPSADCRRHSASGVV